MDQLADFNSIQQRYSGLVLGIVLNYKMIERDIVFDEIWDKLLSLHLSGKLRLISEDELAAFITTLSKNYCNDVYRKNAIRRKHFGKITGFDTGEYIDDIDDNYALVLKYCKQEFSDFDYQLIHMRYVDGLPFDKIALKINRNESTIRVHVHRCMKHLKCVNWEKLGYCFSSPSF